MQDSTPAVPATIGLGKVMTLIRGDQPTLSERIGGVLRRPRAAPAVALAGVAVFAVQGGVIFGLVMRDAREDDAEMRAMQGHGSGRGGPMLKLNFAPDAKEADIRFLLMSVQGTLAGGPGQLGDYYVRVPRGKEAAIAAQLKIGADRRRRSRWRPVCRRGSEHHACRFHFHPCRRRALLRLDRLRPPPRPRPGCPAWPGGSGRRPHRTGDRQRGLQVGAAQEPGGRCRRPWRPACGSSATR